MASVDTSRRQLWAVGLKSALATAAVVGTVGGWIAFGERQPAASASSASQNAVAGAPDFGATQNNDDNAPSFGTTQQGFAPQPFDNQTQQNNGTQPSFGGRRSQRGAITGTRSSR